MRTLIVGAGGVGGYFGGRLTQAGAQVTFLVRPERAQLLKTQGLRLTSAYGDWSGDVSVVTHGAPADFHDLVIIACKTNGVGQAIADVQPFVGPKTRVLPLINGISHMARLEEAFPSAVVGALAHLMVSVSPDGTIVHGNKVHTFRFGSLSDKPDAVLDELAEILRKVPITAEVSPTILAEMWSKFQFIAGFAAVTSALRASAGVIADTDDGISIMEGALGETAAVVAAEGFPVTDEHFSTTLALATEHGSPFTSSMLRDIEAGRVTEAAEIVGDMVKRARSFQIPVPVMRVAWAHLQAYEARRAQTLTK